MPFSTTQFYPLPISSQQRHFGYLFPLKTYLQKNEQIIFILFRYQEISAIKLWLIFYTEALPLNQIPILTGLL